MLDKITRRMDPWTLAIVAAVWALLSASAFSSMSGSLAKREIYSWLAGFGFGPHVVAALMVGDAVLLLATLSPRVSLITRSAFCLTSSALWLEFGCRTLATGINAGNFTPRSSLADLACGVALGFAAIEWPFFEIGSLEEEAWYD